MLSSIKTVKKERGFTLVELLIVIVVIGILAAVSVVSYNGVQGRAKTNSAQTLAFQVQKKAEAWNNLQNAFPTYCQLVRNETNPTGTGGTGIGTAGCTANASPASGPIESKIDDVSKLNSAVPTDEKTVRYKTCTTGAQVTWYSVSAGAVQYISMGGASGSPCS